MDMVGDMLVAHLGRDHAPTIAPSLIRPAMARRFRSLPFLPQNAALNADRLLGRFRDYPRRVRGMAGEFDLFHVVDHSYSQLLHDLPPDRTIVTCHDLDTFRCVLEPACEPRSRLFRAMAGRILEGFRQAAHVTCDSFATRDQLVAHRLIPAERLTVIHNGAHPTCSPAPDAIADAEAAKLLGPAESHAAELLHVGSTIARKGIDTLLESFARLRGEFSRARLIRVGGPFSDAQLALIKQLHLDDAIVVLPFLTRPVLAAVYRRAALLLFPSTREGFGFPVVEAMACGTPVIASDIAVLREVGGEAATYCPVANISAWTGAATRLVRERQLDPDRWETYRAAGLAQASKFTWTEYARQMVDVYRQLL